MIGSRSFTEYIGERFRTEIYIAVSDFVEECSDDDYSALDLRIRNVHQIGDVEVDETRVKKAYPYNLPDMMIGFDIIAEADFIVNEGDYHYDNADYPHQWFLLHCRGDLEKNLDDFQIDEIEVYNSRQLRDQAMYDSLVPVMYAKDYEDRAEQFLKEVHPKAIVNNTPPDPMDIAKRLGLTVIPRHITKDCSVFGQIYFRETDAEFYDEETDSMKSERVPAKTIVVDPNTFFLYNLGKVNNTIIHECVHWYYHRKAFELDRLCNESASMIGCKVVGGVNYQRSSNDIGKMETQANALTPRIQMPMPSFKVAAGRRLNEIRAKLGKRDLIDLMEPLIDQLAQDYGVSRLAAKIRLLEAGFTEAIGTFNYVDGHYVRPYSFRSGSLKENQTFTISAMDAAVQRLMNPELRALTENGDYLFVENHYVYNTNQYVQYGENGELQLTEYARRHMNECCLIFDMKILSNVDKQYYTECYLNRESSDVTFEVVFHNGYENAPPERQIALRKKTAEEERQICMQMTEDPGQCLKLLLQWRNMNQKKLAEAVGCNEKTISRIINGETQKAEVETGVLICFALHLPPMISNKLLKVLDCPLNLPRNQEHMWINEALTLKYSGSIEEARRYLAQYDVKI